ncbi:LysR family transcriptional regulator [Rhodococcoides fascians A21d2]|uniref:LysR family transcriptional regulator n=1 Tax=Nocardiaceae TaxID=85025 RepID=UPI000564D4A5|nr:MULTISPECIES: LysR family transcriptional regulator [Rhodococcus]OZC48824.1 LysR family transcriptional regulator [Rhodococcus sp. WWJCD1]OZE81262.1 LysR family transcriptional regulator [Rhodococcus sp. 15-649-2-2]QIH98549.1 LysR family transcriptional regulator [Rhodococcus fascians A21d2]
MEIKQLRYFLVVAEELHFARSAERLHVVQAVVSQQIRRLEHELGQPLFDRSKRQVALTAAGCRLVPEARAVLDAVSHAAAAVRSRSDESDAPPHLRLGIAGGSGKRVDLLLDHLGTHFPDLLVTLEIGQVWEQLDAVRSGALDAALVRLPRNDQDLNLIPAWVDRIVVAIPTRHPLASKPDLALADLADLPLRLIPSEQNPAFAATVLRACADSGFEPGTGIPFRDLQTTVLELGSGPPSWTAMYEGSAQAMSTERVTFRPVTDPGMVVQMWLAVRERTTLVDALAEACAHI